LSQGEKKKREANRSESFLLSVVEESFVSGVSDSKLLPFRVKFELLSPEVVPSGKLEDFRWCLVEKLFRQEPESSASGQAKVFLILNCLELGKFAYEM
jgi:hypothetical protein